MDIRSPLLSALLFLGATSLAYPAGETAVTDLLAKADAAYRESRFSEAAETCRQAQAADPKLAASFRKEALVLVAMGDVPGALAALEKGLGQSPNDAPSLNTHALLLIHSGHTRAALSPALRATRLHPDSAAYWDTLGQSYVATGQLEAARAAFRRALKCDSAHAAARKNLAGTGAASE